MIANREVILLKPSKCRVLRVLGFSEFRVWGSLNPLNEGLYKGFARVFCFSFLFFGGKGGGGGGLGFRVQGSLSGFRVSG